MPVKVLEIKEKIQCQFDIPKSFQFIYFKEKCIEDDQTLTEVGLNSGDTLEVGNKSHDIVQIEDMSNRNFLLSIW